MKICIDLTSIYDKLSGIEKYALNIAKSMLLQDFENQYILIFKNEIHKEYEFIKERINISYKIIKVNNKLVLGQLILPIYLYTLKCDCYLFLAFQSPLLFFSKKIINTVHDMTPWLYPRTMSFKGLIYFRLLIRNAMSRSKLVITISQSAKRDINKFFKNDNIYIIYCGVDEVYANFKYNKHTARMIKKKYSLPDKYILTLGTVEPRKNLKLLFNAFLKLKNEHNFKYPVVCTGRKGWKNSQLFVQAKEVISSEEVIFTGFVNEEDLKYIYYGASCFIFPSLYEGFGMPPLEAMSIGVPVITSDSSSLPEVVGEGEIIFESNNVEDLANRIIEFFSLSKVKKKEMIEYGRKRSKRFKWEKESKKLIEILKGEKVLE